MKLLGEENTILSPLRPKPPRKPSAGTERLLSARAQLISPGPLKPQFNLNPGRAKQAPTKPPKPSSFTLAPRLPDVGTVFTVVSASVTTPAVKTPIALPPRDDCNKRLNNKHGINSANEASKPRLPTELVSTRVNSFNNNSSGQEVITSSSNSLSNIKPSIQDLKNIFNRCPVSTSTSAKATNDTNTSIPTTSHITRANITTPTTAINPSRCRDKQVPVKPPKPTIMSRKKHEISAILLEKANSHSSTSTPSLTSDISTRESTSSDSPNSPSAYSLRGRPSSPTPTSRRASLSSPHYGDDEDDFNYESLEEDSSEYDIPITPCLPCPPRPPSLALAVGASGSASEKPPIQPNSPQYSPQLYEVVDIGSQVDGDTAKETVHESDASDGDGNESEGADGESSTDEYEIIVQATSRVVITVATAAAKSEQSPNKRCVPLPPTPYSPPPIVERSSSKEKVCLINITPENIVDFKKTIIEIYQNSKIYCSRFK